MLEDTTDDTVNGKRERADNTTCEFARSQILASLLVTLGAKRDERGSTIIVIKRFDKC